jgi:drug/metabolite transporter (DMT)-like permease
MRGVASGFVASLLLGWAPIIGKLAYGAGVDPITVASMRTVVAAALVWFAFPLTRPKERRPLSWRLVAGCLFVGAINGIGSLFYYSGLARLDASRAALLGALYPVWVVLFLGASGQAMDRYVIPQLAASMLGAVLVASPWRVGSPADFLGAMLMVASAAVNGWYLAMGQWVLADVPAQTGTVFILTGMAVTVFVAQLAGGQAAVAGISLAGWQAILALGLTTALSRLAMFFSLATLGGVQTAILSLVELATSLGLAYVFFGDRLTWFQWLGAGLLLGGGLMARLAAEGGDSHATAAFDPLNTVDALEEPDRASRR